MDTLNNDYHGGLGLLMDAMQKCNVEHRICIANTAEIYTHVNEASKGMNRLLNQRECDRPAKSQLREMKDRYEQSMSNEIWLRVLSVIPCRMPSLAEG